MDKAKVEALNGKITQIGLRLEGGGSYEVVDGQWKKYGIAPEITLALGPDADPAEEMAKLTDILIEEIKDFVAPFEKLIAEKPVAPPTPVARPAQQQAPKQHAGMLENPDEEGEYVTFPVQSIEVAFAESGTKFSKVKGGKWVRHGVKCWEEVLALDPVNVDLSKLEAGAISFPSGLQAVAWVVGGTPKKVTGWA